jgi:hypothetical protein
MIYLLVVRLFLEGLNPIPIVEILRGGVNQYEEFLPLSITISKLQLYQQYIIYDFIK